MATEDSQMRSIYLVLSQEVGRVMDPLKSFHNSMYFRCVLGFAWYLLHLLVSIIHVGSYMIHTMHCYLISSGIFQKYRNLPLYKLKYLAVVIDSEEATDTKQVKKLLHWLSDIGLQYTILYDMDGVLKKFLGTDQYSLADSIHSSNSCSDTAWKHVISRINYEKMTIELLSSSDGKEGIVKAANYLFSRYFKGDNGSCSKLEPKLTESDMSAALKAIGCDGPDPDLLLVYGPARCHLGFPAWRMRYTEIVHMGSLKSLKYGAIIKEIFDFSFKHQNYGT